MMNEWNDCKGSDEDVLLMHRMFWNLFGMGCVVIFLQAHGFASSVEINTLAVTEEISLVSKSVAEINLFSGIKVLNGVLGLIALYLLSTAIVRMMQKK